MPIRVVIAKPGLDGHDRGAKVVARALRDAGMEVVYTGLHNTPEQIVTTAIQEDAQAIGLSIHSGAHMTLFPRVVELLRIEGAHDVIVFGGGIIPREDIERLKEAGVAELFTPGTPMRHIVDWVRRNVPERSGRAPEVRPGRPPEVRSGRAPEVRSGRAPEVRPGRAPEVRPGRAPEVRPGRAPEVRPETN